MLADIEPAQVCEVDEESSGSKADIYHEIICEMASRVDRSVPLSVQQQLMRLLKQYKGTFSTGENDLGRTQMATHRIETIESRPVRQPLRRHPRVHDEVIKQQVQNMMEQKIIEPARSPWASNVVIVKKKDQTYRMCLDFRSLKLVTEKDAYPLPRTDACLDAMSGSV